jgi:hypothetical protein
MKQSADRITVILSEAKNPLMSCSKQLSTTHQGIPAKGGSSDFAYANASAQNDR